MRGGAELVHSVDSSAKAVELANIFLTTPYEGGRHDKRIAMME